MVVPTPLAPSRTMTIAAGARVCTRIALALSNATAVMRPGSETWKSLESMMAPPPVANASVLWNMRNCCESLGSAPADATRSSPVEESATSTASGVDVRAGVTGGSYVAETGVIAVITTGPPPPPRPPPP